MCRWVLYQGPEIPLSWLLTRPSHSIIHQSYCANLREEPLNGDGFGVAWYAPAFGPEPAVFRSIQPAWNNTNLTDLARVTASSTILAHVRAATPGLGVSEDNCHPFRAGRFAFMHNGNVAGFHRLKRRLLTRLSDEAFSAVHGSTDSEHVFGLFLDELRGIGEPDPGERMARALEGAVRTICALADEAGQEEPTYLNLALSDGNTSVITRFVHRGEKAHSLFIHEGKRYLCDAAGVCHMLDPDEGNGAVLVASEPLGDDPGWAEVPQNSLWVLRGAESVERRPLNLSA